MDGVTDEKNVNKQKLLEDKEDKGDEEYIDTVEEVEPQIGGKKDPLSLKKISLGTDFYSLTWHSLKKGAFDKKTVRGVQISLLPQDYFWIYVNFISFVLGLLLTVFLIVQEALIDDEYFEGDWSLVFLRMLLVLFTQLNLGPEIELGYAKFLYPIINPDQFWHPSMAIFIGFSHVFICINVMFGLIIFICMADEFADPVINFAGICVLSQLDDWMGDYICLTHKLDSDDFEDAEDEETQKQILKKRSVYDLKRLNEKMSLYNKMAMLADDSNEIFIDEGLYTNSPFYIIWFEKLVGIVPWKIVLPLSTIPISYALPYTTLQLRNYFGYN